LSILLILSAKQKSHAQKNAWLRINARAASHLPSAALPASGSRGSSTTSQPSGSPALISDFEITTHVPEVKDISHDGHEGHEGTQSSNDVVTLVDFV
jgi:hypothetical protein